MEYLYVYVRAVVQKEVISMDNIQGALQLFLKGVRQIMGANISKILVYGSYARGDYNENSDVDIMILSSLQDEEIEVIEDAIYDVAFVIMMEYGIQISVIVKNEAHFRYWLGALPFYDNVEREGVELLG